ncbi:hypothetical protein EYC80_010336 [Monilinia laxa]|uniref:Uncharacterized protein n=1 Tax=Monilinia laxa TaxID=61186 RepID=A0A5N6JPX7_MONLA|nr:hypothetical protein EYC80_010336 [Monilinia laxa]
MNVIANGNGNGRGDRSSDPDEDQDQDSDSGVDTRSKSQKIRDRICRINVCAQLANSMVKPTMLNADVHPKVDANGKFPRIFNTPKRVREFMNMDAHTLDQFLSAYELPKTDDAKRNPRAAVVRRAVIEPADLAGLSSSDPRLAKPICWGCMAKFMGWILEWEWNGNGNGNMVQQGGALVVDVNKNQGTRSVVGRGGGIIHGAGDSNGVTATGSSTFAAGAGTGGSRLILTQGIQGAQNQSSGANGVIPNRLNNNNIGLAQPANHNSHGNVSGGRLAGRRRSNLGGS